METVVVTSGKATEAWTLARPSLTVITNSAPEPCSFHARAVFRVIAGGRSEPTPCTILLADGTVFETVIYSLRRQELPDAERLADDIPHDTMS